MREEDKRCGGIGVVFRDYFSNHIITIPSYTTFEQVTMNLSSTCSPSISLSVIYRPKNLKNFLTEFEDFLERTYDLKQHIIVGDFNIHADIDNDSLASRFINLISHFNFKQVVDKPMHICGHTLDLLLTRCDSHLLKSFDVHDYNISDHYLVLVI